MTMQFLIGTSGWTYDHWKGSFYPADLAKSRWFDYYAAQYPAVEVNATFYRTFADQTYLKWRERAPAGFTYVLKAPRFITHRKYLADAGDEIRAFWRSASLLEDKLGLILLQVAPATPFDLERLRQALLAFGDPRRVAVEFRRKDWLNDQTVTLLRDCGAAFVSVDSPRVRPVDWVTSQVGYLRLHGRSHWYSHDYTPAELDEIAETARHMAANGAKMVYIFFNNDFEGYAPRNALALMTRLPGPACTGRRTPL
jgi:uncharacterized protein YecE (DUF72 family)